MVAMAALLPAGACDGALAVGDDTPTLGKVDDDSPF